MKDNISESYKKEYDRSHFNRSCEDCSYLVSEDALFCSNCGKKLKLLKDNTRNSKFIIESEPINDKDYNSNKIIEQNNLCVFTTNLIEKSTLAKIVLKTYYKYPEIGFFVFDSEGEFSNLMLDNSNGLRDTPKNNNFNLNTNEILNSLGKKFEIINVEKLMLDRWELFEEILYESSFFPNLSIKGENKRDAVNVLINELKNRLHIGLPYLKDWETYQHLLNTLRNPDIQLLIYSTDKSRKQLNRSLSIIDENYVYERFWKPICQLFHYRPGAQTVDSLLKRFTNNEKPLVIVDLSSQSAHNLKLDYWNENIRALIIKRILFGLINLGEKCSQRNISLNTLVVLDEVHRFARKEKYKHPNLKNLRLTLLDAVRTTRKHGLGWIFISPSLSSLHKDILQLGNSEYFTIDSDEANKDQYSSITKPNQILGIMNKFLEELKANSSKIIEPFLSNREENYFQPSDQFMTKFPLEIKSFVNQLAIDQTVDRNLDSSITLIKQFLNNENIKFEIIPSLYTDPEYSDWQEIKFKIRIKKDFKYIMENLRPKIYDLIYQSIPEKLLDKILIDFESI